MRYNNGKQKNKKGKTFLLQSCCFFSCVGFICFIILNTPDVAIKDEVAAIRQQFKKLTHTEPCARRVHNNLTLWIAMTSWNDKNRLHKALRSLDMQQKSFSNINTVVYEDISESMFSDDDKNSYENTVFLHQLTDKNMGSAYSKYRIFEYIKLKSNPNDYVMVFDGDDVLHDDKVLLYIYETIISHKPWFMWGKISGKFEDQCNSLPVKTNQFRKYAKQMTRQRWPVCHPRIFKTGLLTNMSEEDFKNENQSWLQKATDRPFIFKFLEQAGDERIHFLNKREIYNYTWTKNNGLLRFAAKNIVGDRDYVNSRPVEKKLPEYLDIVTCMWKRRSELEFISSIMNSTLEKNHQIRLHICNNYQRFQYEREKIAKNFEHVTVHNMKENTFGFGRFILANKIMQQFSIDYIIMIDDDMIVNNDTILNVYKSRLPRTYSSWYGKNWQVNQTNYWKPKHQLVASNPTLSLQQFPNTKTWHYGGTGMSIIDASIFLTDTLFECPTKYKNVEDMWLSYIVQLRGWEILRLFVNFKMNNKQSDHGQWKDLKMTKNHAFRDFGYLAC